MRETEYELRDSCPQCQGAGSIWTLDGEVRCPRCQGTGKWVDAASAEEATYDLGEPPANRGWRLYDPAALIERITSGEWERPRPTIGELMMATESPRAPLALFYRGRVNSVYGPPDSGKTFTTEIASRQVLADGGTVLFIDFEDTPEGVYPKMLDVLGVPPEHLKRFLYVEPTRKAADEDLALLRELLDTHRPALVIVDSTGEGLALDGLNQNHDDEVARWMRAVPTMMANHDCAPAVVLIDHIPKGDGRGGVVRMPIGSQRKQAVVRGASYHQEEVVPFSQTQTGYARLTCTKDKGGTYSHGQEVARLSVTALGQGRTAWELLSIDPDESRQRGEAAVRQRIVDALLRAGSDGRTAIKGELLDGIQDSIDVPRGVRPSDVLDAMVAEGVVLARRCGKACGDRTHDDPEIKRNANKTHFTLAG